MLEVRRHGDRHVFVVRECRDTQTVERMLKAQSVVLRQFLSDQAPRLMSKVVLAEHRGVLALVEQVHRQRRPQVFANLPELWIKVAGASRGTRAQDCNQWRHRGEQYALSAMKVHARLSSPCGLRAMGAGSIRQGPTRAPAQVSGGGLLALHVLRPVDTRRSDARAWGSDSRSR